MTNNSSCDTIQTERERTTNLTKRKEVKIMAKSREQIERAIFILECKDHWNNADWQEYERLCRELREVA